MDNKFKKILSLILLTAYLSQSVIIFGPNYVEAAGGAVSGSLNTGVSAGGILGTAAQCVFPSGLNNDTVKNIASSIFDSKAQKEAKAAAEAATKAAIASTEATNDTIKATAETGAALTSVPVSDHVDTVEKGVDRAADIAKDSLLTNNYESNISSKADEEYKKTHCMDLIVHLVTTKIIDKMTLATVKWINSGFEGSPFYLTDPGQFFGNIAKEEIDGVNSWFACSGIVCDQNYPFGKLVMTSILTDLQGQLQTDMKFNLNQILAHGDYQQFKADFSVGGWSGYNAFLQPQNNPIGNYFSIQQALSAKLDGTYSNQARTLQKQIDLSGGFLDQRTCIQSLTGNNDYISRDSGNPLYLDPDIYTLLPLGVTMTGDLYAVLPPAVQQQLDGANGTDQQTQIYNHYLEMSTCEKWKVETPGSLIANQLTTNINAQTDKLINADSLGENLGLIFDALLNQLVEKGLSSLQGGDSDVLVQQYNGLNPGGTGVDISDGNSIDTGASIVDIITGNGSDSNPNILDLSQVQSQYILLANNAIPILQGVIDRIYALDYCVPGPNPNWTSQATANLQQLLLSTPQPPNTSIEANENFYHDLIHTLTGVSVQVNDSISNQGQFTIFMNNSLTQFINVMNQSYSLTQPPPTERIYLSGYFQALAGYQADLSTLQTYIQNITPLLDTLASIQAVLNNSAANNNGVVDQNDPNVQVQLALFDSISDNFVTQAQLNTLNTQIGIYNSQSSLLDQHIANCIAEVTNSNYNAPDSRVPYPIDFTYSGMPTNIPLPDDSFLPGVDLGDEGDGIDVETGGINVTSSSNGLETFMATLQSVY